MECTLTRNFNFQASIFFRQVSRTRGVMTQSHIPVQCCRDKIMYFHTLVTRTELETCSKNASSSDKVTSNAQNTSPMCKHHMILRLQRVAATYPCVMTPQVREPLSAKHIKIYLKWIIAIFFYPSRR